MNELVIPPSPSWFEVDILTCAPDNTVIYASLHDIVIVKPTPEDKSNDVVIITRAHCLKIKCVNINPNWGSPHKYIVSLGEDKIVNLWDAESLKKINQHNRHINEKSPGSVVGASFAEDDVVISVLENGDVIKWNILRNETHILKFLHGSKITVFSICPHARWMVAFGLKNGQIFIGDLRKDGKILYKLTGHQRPVLSLSWCPVSVNIFPAKVPDKNESVSEVTSNDNRNKQQGYSKKNKDKKKRNSNKDSINLSSNIATCKDLAENVTSEIESPTDRRITSMDISHSVERMPTEIYLRSPGNASEVLKELSNTNNSMLNITNSSSPKEGNRFNYGTPTSGNQSIEFSSTSSCKQNLSLEPKLQGISSASDNLDAQALHLNDEKDNTSYWRNGIQSGKEFLLASAAREWDIYIWRAGTDGKVETFFSIPQSQGQRGGNIQEKFWITICWVSPNILLSSSRSADLLAWTLPKPTDSSKSYRVVTKRHNQVLFTIKAPVIYSNVYDKSFPICTRVWTTGMEGLILNTDLVTGYILSSTQTFGSGINCLVASSLDPNRVLIGTGSGGLHILEADKFGKKHVDAPCIHSKTSSGVTAAAWSPIDEKILAFGTSEGRVGVFLNSDRSKTPKFLRPYFTMDILKIEWGPLIGDDQLGLYVQCDCKVAIYNPREIHREPLIVKVPDNMSSYTMSWKPDFSRFLVATKEGAVVIYNRDMEVINVSYLPTKLQSINWHPYAVMGDSTSKYSSTFVSISKGVNVTIYILTKNFGNIQECAVVHYENPKTITSVSWDPHTGKRLVILDERAVAQIYDVESGTIISTYINSGLEWLLHACWSPVDDDLVMVGTQKGKLIIWKISEHPPVPDEQVTAYKKNVKKQLQNVSSKPRNIEPNRIRQPDIKLALSLPFLNIKNHNKIAEDLKKFLYYKTMNNAEELTTDVSGNADLLDALGAQSRFQQVLERNISNLKQSGQYPNSDMLSLLNGDIQATIMEAIDQKRVTPWIITLCPMVSDRVWKQACATYALQLQEDSNSNPLEVVTYLLACHQVEESIYYLCDQEMFKEAFVLAKTRFGENSPMLKTVSQKWATRLVHNGNFELAALCYLSMDKFKDAASVLFGGSDVELLEIALEIAEVSGNEELVKSVKFRCQTFKPQLDARQVAENRKVSVIEEELAADSENNELPDVKADVSSVIKSTNDGIEISALVSGESNVEISKQNELGDIEEEKPVQLESRQTENISDLADNFNCPKDEIQMPLLPPEREKGTSDVSVEGVHEYADSTTESIEVISESPDLTKNEMTISAELKTPPLSNVKEKIDSILNILDAKKRLKADEVRKQSHDKKETDILINVDPDSTSNISITSDDKDIVSTEKAYADNTNKLDEANDNFTKEIKCMAFELNEDCEKSDNFKYTLPFDEKLTGDKEPSEEKLHGYQFKDKGVEGIEQTLLKSEGDELNKPTSDMSANKDVLTQRTLDIVDSVIKSIKEETYRKACSRESVKLPIEEDIFQLKNIEGEDLSNLTVKKDELSKKSKDINESQFEVIDLDKYITEYKDFIEDKDKKIEHKDKEIEDKDKEIEDKDREIEDKDMPVRTVLVDDIERHLYEAANEELVDRESCSAKLEIIEHQIFEAVNEDMNFHHHHF